MGRLTCRLVICILTIASMSVASSKDTLTFKASVGIVRSDFTDQEILAATYSSYRVPEGFYGDRMDEGVSYVNTLSIHDKNESNVEFSKGRWVPKKQPDRIELCTQDLFEATRWQEATEANSSEHWKVVSQTETERYFEFRTERLSYPFYKHLIRVHKCSYIDRTNFNPRAHYTFQDFQGWFKGVFGLRPFSQRNVRELGEYLWSIENKRVSGARVMSSFCHDQGDEFVHTLFTLRKTVQDQNTYSVSKDGRQVAPPKYRELADVNLVRLDYHINKKTGDITLDSKKIRTIRVRDNPPELIKR